LVGEFIVDFGAEEDDAFAVEAVVDVYPVGGLGAGDTVGYFWDSNRHHFDGIAILMLVISNRSVVGKSLYSLGHGRYNSIVTGDE